MKRMIYDEAHPPEMTPEPEGAPAPPPIGTAVSVPPPGKDENVDYLTQDIVSTLAREVDALVDRRARQRGIGRRRAACIVYRELKQL